MRPVTRAPTTDAVTFRTIFDQHLGLVTRALRRLGAGEPDLPDLVQQVFLVAFRRLPDFEERSRLGTWLFGICRRVASDHRKSTYRRNHFLASFRDIAELAPHADDPSVCFERQERLNTLHAVMEALPEPQRKALVLFELEEMPGQRIADSLEISLGTLRSRVRLARRRIERGAATCRVVEG